MKTQPQWLKISAAHSAKAHLLNENLLEPEAWCGASLASTVDAPYDERCTSCVKAVQEYVAALLVPPPARLTTTYQLTVTRPATGEDPINTLRRRLAANTSWEWHVVEVADLPEAGDL